MPETEASTMRPKPRPYSLEANVALGYNLLVAECEKAYGKFA